MTDFHGLATFRFLDTRGRSFAPPGTAYETFATAYQARNAGSPPLAQIPYWAKSLICIVQAYNACGTRLSVFTICKIGVLLIDRLRSGLGSGEVRFGAGQVAAMKYADGAAAAVNLVELIIGAPATRTHATALRTLPKSECLPDE